MNPKLILLTLALSVGSMLAEKTSYKGYKLLDVYPVTIQQVNLIGNLQHNEDFDLWTSKIYADGEGVKVSLSPLAFKKYSLLFKISKIEYRIVEDNLQDRFDQEERDMKANALRNPALLGRYVRYSDHMNYMQDTVFANPDMCSTYVAGRTVENRDLRVIVIKGTTNPTKRVWIDCGIHAREWVTPATCMWIIDTLIKEYRAGVVGTVALLNYFEIHVMPLHNPDGYEFAHTTTRLWRKNRRLNPSSTCYGTDLNRNFPDHWMTGGASNQPCSDTFAGPSAGSEAETQAVIWALNQHIGTWQAFLTIHSYGKWVFTPFGWSTTQLPSDYNLIVAKAQLCGQRIMSVYGQTGWTWGSSAQLLYIASGGSDDTAYANFGIRYSHCLELRPGQTGTDSQFGFTLPEDRAPLAGQETYVGVVALLTDVMNNYGPVGPVG